ncbi:chromatin assembly factor 1 subunit b [Anaeramoeba flamelloides]|uniref:Chromatin assembly factor 1 subunit b n=1 Tax=Anaeramoeba flamelloides TaxID=1746091 RepID=A0AAV7ZIJ7_9EUKA|nr:chromatin assembly factor 1 subunit b [Anaeramoeba flamelloides]
MTSKDYTVTYRIGKGTEGIPAVGSVLGDGYVLQSNENTTKVEFTKIVKVYFKKETSSLYIHSLPNTTHTIQFQTPKEFRAFAVGVKKNKEKFVKPSEEEKIKKKKKKKLKLKEKEQELKKELKKGKEKEKEKEKDKSKEKKKKDKKDKKEKKEKKKKPKIKIHQEQQIQKIKSVEPNETYAIKYKDGKFKKPYGQFLLCPRKYKFKFPDGKIFDCPFNRQTKLQKQKRGKTIRLHLGDLKNTFVDFSLKDKAQTDQFITSFAKRLQTALKN